MNRITWKAWTGLLLCLAAAGTFAQTTELKVSLFAAPSNPLNQQFTAMAKELEAKSKGRLKLTLYHVSQLGPPPRQYDLVRTGVADMAYILHGLTPGRFPLTELVELPLLSPNAYAASMALADMASEYLAAEHAGVRLLGFSTTPPVPLLTTKVAVRSLADLKGRRIRHPGPVHSATIATLGATPLAIQPGDVNEALDKGQIDGAVMGYSGATSFKLNEILKFASSMNLGVATFAAIMNPASYEKLPADLKRLIDEQAGPDAQRRKWAPLLDAGEEEHMLILRKAGVTSVELNAKDQEEFKRIAARIEESTLSDLERKGVPARAYFLKLKASVARHSSAKK